ncbi:WD40 repeat domain-containing protein [Ktedonospora formicarum]|uniref:Translation initiation factor beta propellor-like domain-containing protein n=1 Tax=Ktedonospora formicarum TaxID=2778364 RepID=A0A8J3I2K6_9CHLR|nr:WD40 repeat domain-containing protein [Ktedonospora formicarum]GHO48164.1 hypothetical protein KSX_63270 [Ktedonospora formicarum]
MPLAVKATPVQLSRRTALAGLWSAGTLAVAGYGFWQYAHEISQRFTGLQAWQYIWSRDSKYIALHTSMQGRVKLWDVRRRAIVYTLADTNVNGVTWSPDGRYLATTAEGTGQIQIWNAITGRASRTLPLNIKRFYPQDIAWSSDGQRIYVSGSDYNDRTVMARAIDVVTGEGLAMYTGDGKMQQLYAALNLSPDGRYLSGVADPEEFNDSDARAIYIWECATARRVATYRVTFDLPYINNKYAGAMWLGGSERFVIANFGMKAAQIFEVKERLPVLSYKEHEFSLEAVASSPSGEYVASAGYRGDLRIWHARTGETVKVFAHLPSSIITLSWSPDARYLVACLNDGETRLWDMTAQQGLFGPVLR